MHHSPRTSTWASYLRERWRKPPCGQISQLEVHQLLAAGPLVIYPWWTHYNHFTWATGQLTCYLLNILPHSKWTCLPEDWCPFTPHGETRPMMPPLGKVSTLLIASPHKSPPKSEGSMTTEVSNLLSWAVLEASSCELECSSPRRPTTAAVLMTPPQKPEGLLQAVDTSSQVSIEEAEASLEDIPTNISPIAAISRSGSISPLVDLVQLWTNANRALDDLLNTKGSIDPRRWRAVWELGIIVCQNESQVAASIKEAKVICSQAILDAWTACSQLILRPRLNS